MIHILFSNYEFGLKFEWNLYVIKMSDINLNGGMLVNKQEPVCKLGLVVSHLSV